MEDDFAIVIISREELNSLWNENSTFNKMFKNFRKLCKSKGLSYSNKLWIKSWYDSDGNLRQQNYIRATLEEENEN